MNLRCFFSRHSVHNVSKLNAWVYARLFSRSLSGYRCVAAGSTPKPPSLHPLGGISFINWAKDPKFDISFTRSIHTSEQVSLGGSSSGLQGESENDAALNEYLSRFVWVMRKRLSEAYPEWDKNTINGMLVIIVENVISEIERGGLEKMTGTTGPSIPSQEFSEDLWRTVWEVSNVVLQDMEKEKKKERMKSFLQSEEVKEMYRFAGQVGIRGDMLRELRFKWAREKMEKSDFYENLERIRKEEAERESQEKDPLKMENVDENKRVGDNDNVASAALPKRHGKIKYKIYGLDLSDPKWGKVANKIHETGEVVWPQEAKPMSGKCKLVTDKILSLQEKDDPVPLLREWIGLVQPSRVDWIALLDKLEEHNPHLYLKIAEFVLSEESFQANIRDYSKLTVALAKENRTEDAEKILQKMSENGIVPDVIMLLTLVQLYCKSGNVDRAKEAFDSLRAQGFKPDMKVYNSMIMALVNAGQPKNAGALLTQMEVSNNIKPTKEICMALLRSYAKADILDGAHRMFCNIQLSGFDLEAWTTMIEAYTRAGDPGPARTCFNHIMELGHKPDDGCTATMIAAYEKKNLLDEALNLLLELEKNGFVPGVATYTVLVDWLTKLELFDEAEQILDKIAEQGEAPPLKLHISLCDMYVKSGAEKKALQALGVLESKIEQLEPEEFERIIGSLTAGGFVQDAQRIHGLMEARGFVLSDRMKVSLMASQAVGKSKSKMSSLVREK